MIPADWEPYHRIDDGELLGYLVPDDAERVVPTTLFGHRLDAATDRFVAEQVLEDLGLSYLADRWTLVESDGSERRVVLVEVDAERVVVQDAAHGQAVGAPSELTARVELEVPTDRLRRP